ncbi:Signal transduction histidine kinase [Peptoclostridium litorale DSM 5388]|uniref:histidine kinase n=1 Tax=Peptoclostridium litorale DSM 5388 TaxID=1121324 RepID=A0A069RGV8_PEPLI|nr:HAMP domain-containing sensor histidine kinase [Peptoclostridium litorale]KDR96241.1 sensor histidine kinase ResE [Peptoclostridium litorale DSM 5388]SIO14288.1 Signal transduction histidine kinase [Peptoclostridium litorale DSM 5388]
MKKSIMARLFVYTTGIVCSILVLFLILNSVYFERYYTGIKKGQLQSGIINIEEIIGEGYAQTEIHARISEIEEEKGIKFHILTVDYETVYPESFGRGAMMGQGGMAGVSREIVSAMEEKGELFGIYEHPMLGAQFLTYARRLENGYVVIAQSSMGAIRENVYANQRFSIYVSSVALLIGLAVSYFMARSIADPIRKIGEVANSVENLDFKARYEGERRDEIGRLGKSINSMSSRLEAVIGSLNSANEQLKLEIEKEKKIDKMRKDFISAVSHELKTPVALIQGYSEGLMDNVADDERKNFYCEVIQDESGRMGSLVNELLELSRLESGKAEMKMSEFDMVEIAVEISKKHSLMAGGKNVEIKTDIKGEDFVVFADRGKIERAILNYIQNAIKNVREGGEIEAAVEEKEEAVRFGVYNSGSSIPEDEIDMIWSSFYKLDKARSRSKGGSGLGLSIVREIINIHSGSYGVFNRDEGVEFWFEIPKNIKT